MKFQSGFPPFRAGGKENQFEIISFNDAGTKFIEIIFPDPKGSNFDEF
ncbi:hypothetical protein [Chryseobacterium sp. FH1]|nr:hypothetical protein [Chryseobacterium sp. FH1]